MTHFSEAEDVDFCLQAAVQLAYVFMLLWKLIKMFCEPIVTHTNIIFLGHISFNYWKKKLFTLSNYG